MPAIRLIADDLSGALDAVAPFSRSYGTIPVYFSLPTDITGKQCAALSLETRDGTKENSVRQSALAGRFYNGANICYQKIDSLLRGYPAHEIDTLFRLGNFQVALLAPAFPAQKRVTIGGIQRFTSGEPVPHERTNPLQDQLRSLGHDVTTIRHASQLTHVEHGIAVCDAEDDDTLVEIVEAGRLLQPPVLWIGTSGLAHALAEDTSNGNKVNETYGWGDQPILAIIGTNHPVMCEQAKYTTKF